MLVKYSVAAAQFWGAGDLFWGRASTILGWWLCWDPPPGKKIPGTFGAGGVFFRFWALGLEGGGHMGSLHFDLGHLKNRGDLRVKL